MVRLLTFTNLYPSQASPRHGIFVEQRLRRLVASNRVRTRVVVPVARRPWELGSARSEPAERHGIPVRYCSFPVVRGLTTAFHPRIMARCARSAVEAFRAETGDFDLIDGHFLYPDGVGAVHLGEALGKPVVLTARGSDVNTALGEKIAGRSIRWAADRAVAIIAVSAALRDAMVRQGLPAERITVVRNGVDRELFRPGDRAQLRAELGFTAPTLLSVGNLVPEKGHELALAVLSRIDGAELVVIGSGPLRSRLVALASELGVAARVKWLPPLAQQSLARYYGAADLTILTSTREGMPNVLLESLACGTPVVATAVGGAVEIVTEPVAGQLVHSRSPEVFAAACREVLATPPREAAVRAFSERFGWEQPVATQISLLESLVRRA
jgi:teichuronic acid biosynthesis glycosyltransferase TuaC